MRKELTNASSRIYLTIEVDEVNQWIYNTWIGVISTEYAMQGCQAVLEVLRENPYSDMLSNNRQVVGSWSGATEWIALTWTPQAKALGLKRLAHVVSPGIFGQASASEMVAQVGPQLDIRLFDNEEQARAWLRQA